MTAAANNHGAKTVLVAGAGGFVGQELCRQLLDQGYVLHTLCRSPLPADLKSRVRHFQGDILNLTRVTEAAAGTRTVFHLASIAHVYGVPRRTLHRVIEQGTEQVLSAARAAGVSRLVYFSSSLAARTEAGAGLGTDYGRAKRAAEQLLLQRAGDVAVTILRPVNVYGAGMQGNLSTLVRRIGAGRLPPLPRLDTRLALVGVGDLARAAILAAESTDTVGKIYQISDGQAYPINALEAAIYRAWGRAQPGWRTPRVVLYAAAACMDVMGIVAPSKRGLGLRTYRTLVRDGYVADLSLNEDTGFAPETTFYKELPALVQSLRRTA